MMRKQEEFIESSLTSRSKSEGLAGSSSTSSSFPWIPPFPVCPDGIVLSEPSEHGEDFYIGAVQRSSACQIDPAVVIDAKVGPWLEEFGCLEYLSEAEANIEELMQDLLDIVRTPAGVYEDIVYL